MVMSGCDGRMTSREYYTRFAEELPKDTVLLALLSLGIKNIHIGPTLPAFMSPKLRNLLGKKFGLSVAEVSGLRSKQI